MSAAAGIPFLLSAGPGAPLSNADPTIIPQGDYKSGRSDRNHKFTADGGLNMIQISLSSTEAGLPTIFITP